MVDLEVFSLPPQIRNKHPRNPICQVTTVYEEGAKQNFPNIFFILTKKPRMWDFVAKFSFSGDSLEPMKSSASGLKWHPFSPRNPGIRIMGCRKKHFLFGRDPPRAKKMQKKITEKKKKHRLDASIMFFGCLLFFVRSFWFTFETQYWASPTLVPAGITSPTRKPEAGIVKAKEFGMETAP